MTQNDGIDVVGPATRGKPVPVQVTIEMKFSLT